MTEKYNKEWFQKRALKSLKKISDGVWDYSDSLLIYTPSGAEVYENIQEPDTLYFKLVTEPEHEFLQKIARDVATILPDNFEYIDLGPGTEHKEQFLFDELKKQGKSFTYIPVDISDCFLNVAQNHADAQEIKVRCIKSSFEELPEILGKPTVARFVSIGQTFTNYNPQEILKLLKNISGENGYIFIDTQIKDRVDMSLLQKTYQEDASGACDGKLKLLGFDPNNDISPRTTDDSIKIWCSVLINNKTAEGLGIKVGDKIMLLQSLRYTKESLKNELDKFGCDYELLDTGSSFIASIIKTG